MIKNNSLSMKAVDQYEFLFDLLVSINKNQLWIDPEDRFHHLMKNNNENELPEMPTINWVPRIETPEDSEVVCDSVIEAPKESVIELLCHISYMIKNEIKLPKVIIDYLCIIIHSIMKDGYELKKTFKFKVNKENVDEEYAKHYYYIRSYISMRVSILYTLGITWDEIINSKNKKGSRFFQEISDELNFIYKSDYYLDDSASSKSLVSLKENRIKKIITTSGVRYALKFRNFDVMPIGNNFDKKLVEQYRLYLEERIKPVYDSPPLGNKDARNRLKELDLIEEYLNLKKDELPRDKSFKTWLSMKTLSINKK
ncbi:hypothetical protein [Providencia stuartii]|uniref:hypothetical protein n=1 Tax=Providencia stuartii TaxID=588 RepID=UPI0011234038|nr:hypothetical protein [Providencia stuartii]